MKNDKLDRLMRFQLGLIVALLVAIISLNFTTQKKSEVIISDGVYDMDDMLITPPPTAHEKKISPPPPRVEVVTPEEIIEDETIFEEEPEPIVENPQPQTETTSKDIFKIPVKNKLPTPKKKIVAPKVQPKVTPPPLEEKEELPPIVKIAEVMPMFRIPQKENPTEKEIKQYSDKELISFINKNVKYTAIARENGIEGTAVVQFIVEKDGSISGIKVLRDPGGGLGEAAKKAVAKIPAWERTGRQNGVSVRVYYTLPIKFVLDAK